VLVWYRARHAAHQRQTPQPGLLQLRNLPVAVHAELHVLDLVVQLEYCEEQHLRSRRAARQVDVDRHDVINALHDGVVVEHPAARCAYAHRDDPFGLGHLVVDLPQHRGHLLAHPAGHDHQVGLARRI
jgi:hypothetical protein